MLPPFFIDSVCHLAAFVMNVSDAVDTLGDVYVLRRDGGEPRGCHVGPSKFGRYPRVLLDRFFSAVEVKNPGSAGDVSAWGSSSWLIPREFCPGHGSSAAATATDFKASAKADTGNLSPNKRRQRLQWKGRNPLPQKQPTAPPPKAMALVAAETCFYLLFVLCPLVFRLKSKALL